MVIQLIKDTISLFLNKEPSIQYQKAWKEIPPLQKKHIDFLFQSKKLSYRDGLVIQLGYWLEHGSPCDVTIRHKGARSVAIQLGEFLAQNHVKGVRDAYQNIAKNSDRLVRGNVSEFDEFLLWASEEERRVCEIEGAFSYCCYRFACLARPIKRMPDLNKGSLSFSAVTNLLMDLYQMGSKGAYEQFSVAALLHAVVDQSGMNGYRVDTKSLNASDKSSRTAGDVQVLMGNRIVEAFEVTANHWSEKTKSAEKTIRDNDLSRLHVVANIPDYVASIKASMDLSDDISILDLNNFTATLVATLTRSGRACCLARLYELLDRYQPDVDVVNVYVEKLQEANLADL